MKTLFKGLISICPGNLKRYIGKVILFPFGFYLPLEQDLKSLKKKINLYFLLYPSRKKEFINEINFLNNKSKTSYHDTFVMPYAFVFNYNSNQVKVFKDDEKGLFYVLHKGKRLYYGRDFKSEKAVQNSYNWIAIEQDERSPHRYLDADFNVEKDDVVIDIGAAEGNFSLEIVEKASTLYIFESDSNWIEALHATFEPWKEKVHIINKFVSNIDNTNCVKLDSYIGNNQVNFIKMDVEGEEVSILNNSKNILRNNKALKLAVCTYHVKSHAKVIEKLLKENNFNSRFTSGYMLHIFSRLTPPYFRKALLQAQKN